MTAYKGLGNTFLRSVELAGGPSAQNLFPFPTYEFEYTQESDDVKLSAYRAGKRVTEETFESSVTSTLKLKTQISNWHLFGLSQGQFEKTFTGFTLPTAKRAVVPAGGVINDPDIVAGNLASVVVAVEAWGAGWGQARALTRVSAAPTAGQVQAAAGSLTFNAAQAGAPIMYTVDKTYATGNGYGGPGSITKIGALEFHGEIVDTSGQGQDGGKIIFPKIQRTGNKPAITFAGDALELETEYECLTPAGWEEPHWVLDGHSLVV